MSNNKQSSVEWYVKELNILSDEVFKTGITLDEYYIKKNKLIEQAKEIHKKELEEFFEAGETYGIDIITDINNGDDVKSLNFEQYYKKTFK